MAFAGENPQQEVVRGGVPVADQEVFSDSLWIFEEYQAKPPEPFVRFDDSVPEELRWSVGPTERAWARGRCREIKPLQDYPDLFADFASLAAAPHTAETATIWANRYGILGAGQGYAVTGLGVDLVSFNPNERVLEFFREVTRAARILLLYTCALSRDTEEVRDLVESDPVVRGWWDEYKEGCAEAGVSVNSRGGLIGFAVDTVVDQVYEVLGAYAYRDVWRPAKFALFSDVKERWTFQNLLGAIYLQMYEEYIVKGRNFKLCAQCGQPIELTPSRKGSSGKKKGSNKHKTPKHKRFCSDRCRGLFNYHKSKPD